MNKRRRHEKYLERKEARTPLPAYIDLVEWVRLRSRLSRGRARKVVLAGSLHADSHTLGATKIRTSPDNFITRPNFYVSAEVGPRIRIETPEVLNEA